MNRVSVIRTTKAVCLFVHFIWTSLDFSNLSQQDEQIVHQKSIVQTPPALRESNLETNDFTGLGNLDEGVIDEILVSLQAENTEDFLQFIREISDDDTVINPSLQTPLLDEAGWSIILSFTSSQFSIISHSP